MNQDFRKNLRLLTDHYKSVAEVCRNLGINRSQFNKYLSGASNPSRHIFKTLCDFFGVEKHEFLMPHDEFEKLIRLRGASGSNVAAYTPFLDHLVRRSRSDLSEYDGYYFEYSYSLTAPGFILRSLMQITTQGRATICYRLENMARPEQGDGRTRSRYRGLVFYLNDRIFLVDYDTLTRDEICHTILYPSFKSRLTRLSGLKLGVSSSKQREPLCTRVVLDGLGNKIEARNALRQCGLFEPGADEIDPEIHSMIVNSIGEDDFHLRVAPDSSSALVRDQQ